MVHLHNGILHSREKEEAPTLRKSMDGSGEHYAKCNQLGSERQTPYDSPVSGTLSTKQTSKENITRDIEMKNKLRITRGEMGGDNRGKRGKGCQGTCVKNMRWGWLLWEEWWGGNGDNCA